MARKPSNKQLADLLVEIADLLEAQDKNPARIDAYRRGADTIRNHDASIADMIQEERFNDITAIPTIGGGIASVLTEYVVDGRSKLRDDLQADASPVDLFAGVTGINQEAAQHIHDQLHIDSLEELYDSTNDGRLETVDGFGEKKVQQVRDALAKMLDWASRANRGAEGGKDDRPPVELLLDLDEEYRRRADEGDLIMVSPRRFNPNNEPWLPIMKTERDGWNFSILFSNTEQAHRLGRTRDWVVIYHERNGHEKQHTVVTEFQGPLQGKRVVRGRDKENREHYAAQSEPA